MALDTKGLIQEPTGAMYVAPERIFVTAEGKITTDEEEASGGRLLVAKGCEIPADEAAAFGLIASATENPETATRMASAQQYSRAGISTIYTAEDVPGQVGFTVTPVDGGASEIVPEAEFHSEFTAISEKTKKK